MPDGTYPISVGIMRGALDLADIVGGPSFLPFMAAFLPFPFAAGGAFSRMPVRTGAPAGPPIGKA